MRGAEQAFGNESDADELLGRLSDAWAWLESHGLIGPSARNTASVWQRLTRAGHEAKADAAALTKLWAGDRLAGSLHPILEERVCPIFNLGDYETACFAAMKAVEVEVRRLAGLDNAVIGVGLMRQAFKPDGGPSPMAIMELFAGAIGAFKNPSSHRTVHFDDAVQAAEVVQAADLLLRLLQRAARRGKSAPSATPE